MAKVAGVDILLLVNTGSDESPVWTEVGGQRGATLSESLETIDVTAKDSGGAQEFAPGLYSWTISADGVVVVGNEAQAALKTAIRNRQPIKVRWTENGVDVFEGTA
ncbi:MAG TPA: phage tail tube protein, partial [Calditerricola sp.]